jgi:hypothetical protein
MGEQQPSQAAWSGEKGPHLGLNALAKLAQATTTRALTTIFDTEFIFNTLNKSVDHRRNSKTMSSRKKRSNSNDMVVDEA